ncbi:MAG: hypothetical protein Q9165_008770 [Trypethelium subeluteriae]
MQARKWESINTWFPKVGPECNGHWKTTELSAKFRGTASVKAEIFEFTSQYPTDEDDKHPQRMKKLFKEAKNTRKWEIFNHIPATIAQNQLDDALASAGITSAQLLHARGGHLELDFPAGVHLKCLRGRHRVLGDSGSLRPGRRWIVDLFTSGKFAISLGPPAKAAESD